MMNGNVCSYPDCRTFLQTALPHGKKCSFGVEGPPRHGHARPRQRVFTSTQAAKKGRTAREVLISAPIQVQGQEQLTPVERLQMAPFWSTFCGTSNGAWQGVQAAFSPLTGKAEPVGVDGKGEQVLDVRTITLESREVEGDDDRVVRRSLRAASGQRLRDIADKEEWEEEIISSEEDGLVIFDGGTYSRGPSSLLAMEDFNSGDADLQADKERLERQLSLETSTSEQSDDEEEEEEAIRAEADVGEDDGLHRRVWLLEQCLAWGGEQRLRLRLTIAAYPGEEEVEVEVLRIAVLREGWQCLADDDSPACVADPSQVLPEVSSGPRSQPRDIAGQWKVFDVSASPLPDDAAPEGESGTVLVYFGSETAQEWGPGKGDLGDSGGAFWLPNNAVLELCMVPPVSRGAQGDAQEGMETEGTGRGICISFHWLVNERTLIGLQREYSADGMLTEVRSRTAVKGGWVGGRM
ncbi:g1112 [Coccomyxa elongata]